MSYPAFKAVQPGKGLLIVPSLKYCAGYSNMLKASHPLARRRMRVSSFHSSLETSIGFIAIVGGPFFIRAPTFAPLLISFATLLHASFFLTSPREEASSDKSKLVAQLPPPAEADFGFSPHQDLRLNPFSALPFHAIWHQSVDLEEDLFFLLPTLLFPFYFIPSRGFLVAEACKTSGMLLAIS